jgi:hypothetical protein
MALYHVTLHRMSNELSATDQDDHYSLRLTLIVHCQKVGNHFIQLIVLTNANKLQPPRFQLILSF